jgi:Arc/MetJ-type ribon-helix-helix transcriptional regulator
MPKPKTMDRWDFYAPKALFARVDAWAKDAGISARADAVRQLLRAALDAEDAKTGTLPPEAIAYLEKYRRETGAKTVADALVGLVRAHRAAEANLDDGARPPLRIVAKSAVQPAPPPPPTVADLPAAPASFYTRAKRAITGG